MRPFAELAQASDDMIESILKNADRATLALALQGASVRLIDRVLGGCSAGEIQRVLNTIARQQAASLAEIEAAQRQIAEIVDDLESVGIAVG
jgi:flagellar motor switch protein FliG